MLERRVDELTAELEAERRAHREDLAEAERRVFNALGVADKVAGVVRDVARSRRVA